jgi:glycogen phosphorylase
MPTGTIAYFSMEIALADHILAYSGGLGVLAGDTVRAAADLALPMVGVTAGRGHRAERLVLQRPPDAPGVRHPRLSGPDRHRTYERFPRCPSM